MYGLTDSGFSIKRLPIIKEEIEANLRNRINQNIDLRAESLFGQFVGLESEMATIFWEVLQDIYLSQYPDYATGNTLTPSAGCLFQTHRDRCRAGPCHGLKVLIRSFSDWLAGSEF